MFTSPTRMSVTSRETTYMQDRATDTSSEHIIQHPLLDGARLYISKWLLGQTGLTTLLQNKVYEKTLRQQLCSDASTAERR